MATIANPNINITGSILKFRRGHCFFMPPRHSWGCQRRTPLIVSASADSELSSGKRIPWSDVVVKKIETNSAAEEQTNRRRYWSSLDLGTAGVVVFMHLLCLLAPFTFSWGAFWTAATLYVITGLFGITLSFHRNLSHRSFKLPKFLEYTFAYCGVHAIQGNPVDWVSTHRYHHQYCDTERDPHSPIEGFWYSHVAWLFDTGAVKQRVGGNRDNVADLEKQPFYRFIEKTYILHPLGLAAILYFTGGIPFVVWGMGVRTVWVYHITWLVNSACHVWGSRQWNTNDLSKNNWLVGLLAFGEGWHNNHHAFEYSARHGLEWWQIDLTWFVVDVLRAAGLATNVRLPSPAHRRSLAIAGDNNQ